MTRKPDLAAAATGGAIDLFEQFSNFGILETTDENQKLARHLISAPDTNSKVQRDELTGIDFAVSDTGENPERFASRNFSPFPSENWAFDFKNYTMFPIVGAPSGL